MKRSSSNSTKINFIHFCWNKSGKLVRLQAFQKLQENPRSSPVFFLIYNFRNTFRFKLHVWRRSHRLQYFTGSLPQRLKVLWLTKFLLSLRIFLRLKYLKTAKVLRVERYRVRLGALSRFFIQKLKNLPTTTDILTLPPEPQAFVCLHFPTFFKVHGISRTLQVK